MTKTGRRIVLALLLAAAVFALSGCGTNKAGCEIISAGFTENIPAGNLFYTFEEFDIYKIVFNATLAEKFTAEGASAGSDDFRKAIYKHISDGCALEVEGGESKLQWGYWPEKASENSARKMTLFYTVPKGTPASALTFTLDGSVLGDSEYHFVYKPDQQK